MLSEKLKSLRESANLTQKQVADVLNVDRSTYTYYELGKSRPDMDALIKLSQIFLVSVDDLLDYHPKTAPASPKVFHSAKPEYKHSFSPSALPDLDRDEQNLVLLYRCLTGEYREDFVKGMQALSHELMEKQAKQ